MKFCSKCGKEIMDDAVICPGCGCPTGMEKSNTAATKPAFDKKKIVMIVVAAALAVVLLVGAYFLVNHIRTVDVIEDLSGKSFEYYDWNTIGSREKILAFDSNGKLTYSYYFSSTDLSGEYRQEYQIKFKNDMIILVAGNNEYEIQYDKYDKIEGIYDIALGELYD